jgi:hypothetical protein
MTRTLASLGVVAVAERLAGRVRAGALGASSVGRGGRGRIRAGGSIVRTFRRDILLRGEKQVEVLVR